MSKSSDYGTAVFAHPREWSAVDCAASRAMAPNCERATFRRHSGCGEGFRVRSSHLPPPPILTAVGGG